VLDLPLKLIDASTLTISGSILVGIKGFGWAISSLLKSSFQDDEEPELNVGQSCPFFFSCLFIFVAI
jgi:hypothetical protein